MGECASLLSPEDELVSTVLREVLLCKETFDMIWHLFFVRYIGHGVLDEKYKVEQMRDILDRG